ncbi:hypothetical protein OAI94_00830, partial [bacterium]|nr:hypothetical protein [bacterium]
FGQPSYLDHIQNKYFYYTEKTKSRHFFDQKTEYSFLFIFELDQNDEVIKSKAIDLLSTNIEKFINEETENNVIKRGLIERIFGGVGAQRFPDSPQN